jgi:hypothetical protein
VVASRRRSLRLPKGLGRCLNLKLQDRETDDNERMNRDGGSIRLRREAPVAGLPTAEGRAPRAASAAKVLVRLRGSAAA